MSNTSVSTRKASRSKSKSSSNGKRADDDAQRLRIATSLRRWRERSIPVMTREALSAELGHYLARPRALSTIRKWETGESEPRVSDILAMEFVKPGLVEMLFNVA
jgi:hypothetical protein